MHLKNINTNINTNNMNSLQVQDNQEDMDTYVSDDEEIVLQPYTLGMGGSSFKQYPVNFLKNDYVFHIGCTDKKNKKNKNNKKNYKRNKNKSGRRRMRV